MGWKLTLEPQHRGQGKVQPTTAVASQPKVTPKASTPKRSTPKVEETISKVLTQREASVPAVKKQTPKNTPKKSVPKKTVPKKVEEKKAPPAPPKPKVAASTKNILSNVLNAKKVEGKQKVGEGNDKIVGDKGKREGNPYAQQLLQ